MIGALAQHPGKGLLGPDIRHPALRGLMQQHHRPQRRSDVPADAGGTGIHDAADGPGVGPDQGPVAIDGLRGPIALPQGGLGAFSDAAGAGEQDAFPLAGDDIGAVQHQHPGIRQDVEQPRRLQHHPGRRTGPVALGEHQVRMAGAGLGVGELRRSAGSAVALQGAAGAAGVPAV